MKRLYTKLIVFAAVALLFGIPSLWSIRNTRPFVEIPFTIKRNHIFLAATVNGIPGTYVFDTGAGPFLITKHPVSNLGKADIQVDSWFLLGQYWKPDIHLIGSLQLHDVTFNGDFLITQNENLVIPDIDGIIGLPVFRGYFVEISYSKKKIRLYKERPEQYEKNVPIEFADGFWPIVQCYIDGLSVPFLVDTGNDENIVFPLPDAQTIPAEKYSRILNEYDQPHYRLRLESVDCRLQKFEGVTGFTYTISPIDYSPLYAKWGNLGGNFLRKFDFVLDCRGSSKALMYYKHNNPLHRLYLRNGVSPWYLNGRPNARFNAYGIDGWRSMGEAVVITAVWEDGDARANGIDCGTRIVKINGRAATRFPRRRLEDAFLFSKKPLTLTVRDDDGSERDVVLSQAE